MSKRSVEAMRDAKKQFEVAITEDPNFARAYTGLADWLMVWGESEAAPAEDYKKAKVLVTKALELDGSLTEAHASMGLLLQRLDYDWKGAEQELMLAAKINPGYADAHRWYASILGNRGKFDDMIREIRVAVELDPVSASMHAAAGFDHMLAGRNSEALGYYERANGLSPDIDEAWPWIIVILVEQGRKEEAISMARAKARAEPNASFPFAMLTWTLAKSGKLEEARPMLSRLEELKKESKITAGNLWYVYVPFRNFDRAFELVGEALENHELSPTVLRFPPNYRELHSDPRYGALLKKYNLEVQ